MSKRSRRIARQSNRNKRPDNKSDPAPERYTMNAATNPVAQDRADVAAVTDALGPHMANPDVTAVAESLRISDSQAARVIREAPSSRDRDPSQVIDGMAPNFGRFVLPHVATLQGLATSISKTYRISDEALHDSYDNARFMRNDTGVMECVEARQRAVALLDWHLEPEDERSADQKELCAQLEKIIRATPNFLKYRENLLHGVWFGNYGIQHRYAWQVIGGIPRVVARRWLPVHGDKLVFKIEDDPNRDADHVGIRVGPGFQEGQRINGGVNQVEMTERGMAYFLEPWQRKLIAIHKHQIEDGAYEAPWDAGKIHGVGVRSKIYWDWLQKQELLGFLMEYLERSAFGIELWYYPWGNDEAKDRTEAAAKERIGNGRSIVLVPKPLGDDASVYGVEHIEPGLGGVEALKDVLDRYFGHRIKRYILGQTLSSEADATGLGSGLSDLQQATLMDIVCYDATNLEESITTDFVTPLKDWNFVHARSISVRFVIETQSQNAAEKLAAFKDAWEMNARIKESDVLSAIGAGIPNEEDRVLPGPGGNGGAEGSDGGRARGLPGSGPFEAPEGFFSRRSGEAVDDSNSDDSVNVANDHAEEKN